MKKLIFGLFVIGFLAGCIPNPLTGKRPPSLISESQEVAIGAEGNRQIRLEYGIVEDQNLQRYVQAVGTKLALQSRRPNLDWHFTVIDTPAMNAFALPGGYVYVTRGMLAYLNNEAELAGVIAHEIGHISARHSARQVSNPRFAQMALSVGNTITPTFGQFGNFADTPLSLLFMRFNRDEERQADRLGVEYAAKSGYDPREIGNCLEMLRRITDSEDRETIPGWLSTHPDPIERVKDTKQQAQEWIDNLSSSNAPAFTVNRDSYLQNLDGLVFGSDPREGFAQGPHFYSPQHGFQITFPLNWQIENTHLSTIASDPKGGAQIQVSIAKAPSGTTAASYVRQLLTKGFLQERGENTTINGLRAYVGDFTIHANGGLLNATAEFLEYRQNIYQVVAVTVDPKRYHSQIDQSLYSFNKIMDDQILHIQPDRLKLYTAVEGDTLMDIGGETSTPLSDADQLAILNRMAVSQPIPVGRIVKTISRGR